MKKEELIKNFKEVYLNDVNNTIDEIALNDIAESFVEELPIDLGLITKIVEMPYYDFSKNELILDVGIETERMYCQVSFHCDMKPKRVALRQVFKNALDSWYKWSGNSKYNYSYLKDDKVYLYYEGFGEKELYKELCDCRETILSTMYDSSQHLWEKKNIKRWNEYQQYIVPILIAFDSIEEGEKVYE